MRIQSTNNYTNSMYKLKNNNLYRNTSEDFPGTITFKAKLCPNKVPLLRKFGALLGFTSIFAGTTAIEYSETGTTKKEEKEKLLLLEQGRESFKIALSQPFGESYWFNELKKYPEILETLLLEECTHNNKTDKRLNFVSPDNVIGAFYKDLDAIERIFTKESILNLELNGKSCIDKLLLNCPEITNKILLTPDEEGKLILHHLVKEHGKYKRYPFTPFYDLNKTYQRKNSLDILAKMYLTKDANGQYPLDYIKEDDESIQQNVLKTIKSTFEYEPETLKTILENYKPELLLEEQKMQEKIKEALENGCDFIDIEGNRIHVKAYDKSLIREILNGNRNYICNIHDYVYKKYSPDNRLLIDRGATEIITYIYDDNNQLTGKEVESLDGMHSKITTYNYNNGCWIKV